MFENERNHYQRWEPFISFCWLFELKIYKLTWLNITSRGYVEPIHQNEETPLYFSWGRTLKIVNIEKGVNIKAKEKDHKTPFLFVCFDVHFSIIEYLVEKGDNFTT